MSGAYQDAIEAITVTSATDGNYDESVRQYLEDTETHDRFVVSDTSHEGYREVPKRVIVGLYGDGHGAHRTIGGDPSHPCLCARGGSLA
jgi:diaminopropionate ammonia-lyase